jgi:hypothetical protein
LNLLGKGESQLGILCGGLLVFIDSSNVGLDGVGEGGSKRGVEEIQE